ncbi:MAG: hypothetical protein RL088_892 [Verrucomicrobiota bacterium]|jgi:Ca-activated chloride channel family protein
MIQFAAPIWFWAFLSFPFLAALYFHGERKRRLALARLVAARLQPRLAGTTSVAKRRVAFLLTMMAFAFSILALARPQWGFSWEERREMGRDVMIAIDTSRSMLAADLQPSRLKRAKLAAEDLLAQIQGDRVGVIAFAGSSFLQAPLTADFNATRDTIAELDTEIIPRGGTNLTEAIKAADDAFGKRESDNRALIIFTDGEELEDDAAKAAAEHKSKFRIFTVGLGSPDGALIPVPNERGGTQFVRDEKGEYVKSKLDEKRLREVADAGGGFYIHLENGPAEMRRIATEGLGKMKETTTSESRFSKKPTERYQWPLAAAVACWIGAMLIGERKRPVAATRAASMALLLFCGVFQAGAAEDEKPQALFAKADYAGAAKAFEDQRAKRRAPELDYNLGISAYKAGELDKAAEALSGALGNGNGDLQPKAAFGLANVLARRGVKQEKKEDKIADWKNAIQHYEHTLALEPGHGDAAHNRDLLKKLLDELDKQDKSEQDKKEDEKKEDKKDEEKKDQEKKDDQSKSGDGKGDEQKEQEKKEEGKKDGEKKDEQQQENGEKKDGEQKSGGQKDGEKKEGKDGEKKNGEQKADEQKDGENKEKSDKPGEKPAQAEPQKDGEKKQGELKPANPQGGSDENKDQQAADAAEEMAAAAEGRMTAKDAKQLLDSMRNTERRVRLLDLRQELQNQAKPRPEKNW